MTKLRYLYRAVYSDGSMYDQNIEDISTSNPAKSCYNDLKLNQILYFTLSDGIHSFTLDLSDGGFSTNGSSKFYLSDEKLTEFKLVHFRRVTLTITNDVRSYAINFVLGYEAKRGDGSSLTQYIIIK